MLSLSHTHSACAQRLHYVALYIGYRISASDRRLLQFEAKRGKKKKGQLAKLTYESDPAQPKRHSQAGMYPCPGDILARSGLDTTV